MSLSGAFALNTDVLVIPVTELDDASRAGIACEASDFAVSRLGGRSGSKIISADSASLLARFGEPRTMVEAVILFARERGVEPDTVLDHAYPMLRSLVAAGVLVSQDETGAAGPVEGLAPGAAVAGSVVLRSMQVLEDTEVYLARRASGDWSVLKVGRTLGPRLAREAAFLRHLDGSAAPRLYGEGEEAGRPFLEIELIEGVDVATAAAQCRALRGSVGRADLLDLLRQLVRVYRDLHAAGVLHGDVHPRNALVTRDGRVRLVDFGLARGTAHGLPGAVDRGGIPFFFEPELARAYLEESPAPEVSPAGEQYALAALLYHLATGHHRQDFRLNREAMLEDIVSGQPLPFLRRGVPAWPDLEAVLFRALASEPERRFGSIADLETAMEKLDPVPSPGKPARATATAIDEVLARGLARTEVDGPLFAAPLAPAPTASVTYGAAGIALGLLHMARHRNDADLLARADLWARKAARDAAGEGPFYNTEIEITPEIVGESSPYHTATGLHAVAALVARCRGDVFGQFEEERLFLDSARGRPAGLDLTLGLSSLLVGAAILRDATLPGREDAMRTFGEGALERLWRALDAKPALAEADVPYLGVAHGWAGFLYATLLWCEAAGTALPSGVERRLHELAALAQPTGRGLEWPWRLEEGGGHTMAGWCNGTCGYVFLWILAHRARDDARFLSLAERAAWHAWESPDPAPTLCCGLVGRAYALLAMHRHSADRRWGDRARELAQRAATSPMPAEYPHSLYKGEFGLAVLASELDAPEQARMPLFEPLGFR